MQTMQSRPEHLADFLNPPIDEVALAVQFKELTKYTNVHHGLLYERIRDRLPKFEEHAPIGTRFEVFGRTSANSPEFQVHTSAPISRVWFVSEDSHELVQLQSNRFICNWRKVKGEGDYPHFENILPHFFEYLDLVREFLAEHGVGDVNVNQCELSYFNNITMLEGQSFGDAFSKIFNMWGGLPNRSDLNMVNLQSETCHMNTSYKVSLKDEMEPMARLHVDAAPAIHSETEREMVRLTFVARGRPPEEGDAGISKFFSVAREAIVETFSSITTPEIQAEWGRK